jgi:hypothetical protein
LLARRVPPGNERVMSKNINVNPDHYKVAGRERPGNAVAKAPKEPARSAREKSRTAKWQQRQRERTKIKT